MFFILQKLQKSKSVGQTPQQQINRRDKLTVKKTSVWSYIQKLKTPQPEKYWRMAQQQLT